MRLLSLRLIVSLIFAITIVSVLSVYNQVRGERRSLRSDLERRTAVLADSLAANVQPNLGSGSLKKLQQIVDRFSNREHLSGVVIFDEKLQLLAQSSGLSDPIQKRPTVVQQAIANRQRQSAFLNVSGKPLYLYAAPLTRDDDQNSGVLVIVHDARYIQAQTNRLWRETFFRVLVQVFLIVLITVLIVRWSIAAPISRVSQWLRALRVGRAEAASPMPDFDLLRPLAREMTSIAQSLTAARSAAEREAQLRQAAESSWTSERLSVHVRSKLGNSRLFVVSNREPYSHVRSGKTVQCVVPASGLVTALEPILRACEGTWIAHGSGNADQETVDTNDRLPVPPEEPKYMLRRVWLTKEEEEGYYYGFSNEGLWPLCHIAHTRPLFRAADWDNYRKANIKFADAVLEEMRLTRDPVLLVQ